MSSSDIILAAPRAPEIATAPPVLRFLTCGSVDDGKSTLIGRLLFEKNLVFEDHLSALVRDSKKHGSVGADLDFALLLDGLEAEREQGITIDVAYRYFATSRRSFVVADTPGHEQYTRNMVTGASNCELAILLVDARKGLLAQTRRHAMIANLLGIRHIVFAVNKIDLVDYAQSVFERIVEEFSAFAAALNFRQMIAIPISARFGDNVSLRSNRMPWYDRPPLLDYLETVDVEDDYDQRAFRLPVQWVNRPHLDFRGIAGTIASGSVRVGDEVVVLPSGRASQIATILSPGGMIESAAAGDAVTVTLADEIDAARGDMLAPPLARAPTADQFAAHIVWMSTEPLMPGRSYLIKVNHVTIAATVTKLKYRIDTDSRAELAAKTLMMNQIGVCNLSVAQTIAFDPYLDNRSTGAFILIDRASNETVAAGMIDFPLRRSTNVHHQPIAVSKAERSRLMHQKPALLWFTGLSGSGKSTIANLVDSELHTRGVHTVLLDGDNVRHGLNKDLGFTEADRVENIRRVGEVAKLMMDAGLVVLCAFISPFKSERQMVRELVEKSEFIEIFVDTPIAQCIARDPKGLYRKALAGNITNFTGVDQPYEAPEHPELHLRAAEQGAAASADQVVDELVRRQIFGSFA